MSKEHNRPDGRDLTSQHGAAGAVSVKALEKRLSRLAGKVGSHGPAIEPLMADIIAKLRDLAVQGDWSGLNSLAAAAKALRLPIRDLDMLRAQAFFAMNNPSAALEALKEETRYFPDNAQAARMLSRLSSAIKADHSDIDPLLARILPVIGPYTMVGLPRLISLFQKAKQVCRDDLPGDFAECGVAAGGASALLSYAIKRFSKRPRLLYCFDTFSGMPDPGEADVHAGLDAQSSGWGAGTCAAPEQSLLDVCGALGTRDIIRPIRGLFGQTLPRTGPEIDSLAMLHMDGDWYESTRDILRFLYDKVSPDGVVQVDDYGYWDGCALALKEFFDQRGERPAMFPIAGGVGAWFYKPREPGPRPSSRPPVLVNLGCGDRIHPDWINFDLKPRRQIVIAHDISTPLPLDDACADAVYHSHVLEHLPRPIVPAFLRECRRVLRPGGVMRVVVPDLEGIVRSYLSQLEGAVAGNPTAKERYEWSVIELVDQLCRHAPGGEMLAYWRRDPVPAEDYVYQRLGQEAKDAIASPRRRSESAPPTENDDPAKVGAFRLSGECHLWMYDTYSLTQLFRQAGFTDIRVCLADESAIPNFADAYLDVTPEGETRKPDSLFMEAREPDEPVRNAP